MYFTVKYIDLETFEMTKDVRIDASARDLSEDVKNALTVKNMELVVNPDCFIAIIMDYIFEAVGISDDNKSNFDMMTDQAKLLHVHNYAPNYSGLKIFDNRGQYYVAYCNSDGEAKPLLGRKSPELLEVLEIRRRKHSLKKNRVNSSKALRADDSSQLLKRNTLKSTSRVRTAD